MKNEKNENSRKPHFGSILSPFLIIVEDFFWKIFCHFLFLDFYDYAKFQQKTSEKNPSNFGYRCKGANKKDLPCKGTKKRQHSQRCS